MRHFVKTILILQLAALAVVGAFGCARAADLQDNDQVQWVMGDLSALKSAAQMYYAKTDNAACPDLSHLLLFFDANSLPPNPSSLYSVKCTSGGCYVGYSTRGLSAETWNLLERNAHLLMLLNDDLKTDWNRPGSYVWSLAAALDGRGRAKPVRGGSAYDGKWNDTSSTYNTYNTWNTYDSSDGDEALNTAAALVGTAALLSIVTDHDDHYYYYYPGTPWYWQSRLYIAPVYHTWFVDHYYRPLPGPMPRPFPHPVFPGPHPYHPSWHPYPHPYPHGDLYSTHRPGEAHPHPRDEWNRRRSDHGRPIPHRDIRLEPSDHQRRVFHTRRPQLAPHRSNNEHPVRYNPQHHPQSPHFRTGNVHPSFRENGGFHGYSRPRGGGFHGGGGRIRH